MQPVLETLPWQLSVRSGSAWSMWGKSERCELCECNHCSEDERGFLPRIASEEFVETERLDAKSRMRLKSQKGYVSDDAACTQLMITFVCFRTPKTWASIQGLVASFSLLVFKDGKKRKSLQSSDCSCCSLQTLPNAPFLFFANSLCGLVGIAGL